MSFFNFLSKGNSQNNKDELFDETTDSLNIDDIFDEEIKIAATYNLKNRI